MYVEHVYTTCYWVAMVIHAYSCWPDSFVIRIQERNSDLVVSGVPLMCVCV